MSKGNECDIQSKMKKKMGGYHFTDNLHDYLTVISAIIKCQQI